ncbi:uncharacterized protein [Diadema antillarum]|uniref:uncharacterized protein n=1 Tax=Diadema antillarum TaxID=105358 RepID=UPI003A898DE1
MATGGENGVGNTEKEASSSIEMATIGENGVGNTKTEASSSIEMATIGENGVGNTEKEASSSIKMATIGENGAGNTKPEETEVKKKSDTGIYIFTFTIIFLLVAAAVISMSIVFTQNEDEEVCIDNGQLIIPPLEEVMCSSAIDLGYGSNTTLRWGYNADEEACVNFVYNGCGGNRNNFYTKDDCNSVCGDAGGLPKTCRQLQDTPFSTLNVSYLFGVDTTLLDVAPPNDRVGTLREDGALPTQHFACNQINHGPLTPIRQFPHSATMDAEGVTYEAYTLDRWTDPIRQDPSYQMTPGREEAPWEKMEWFGAGMKQMVSAPDSMPLSIFSGATGIRVGIAGNEADPSMTDFGEMYANFLYTDGRGGTMELPIVRGTALLTHIFNDATPVLTPYCLNAINGQTATSDCPEEPSVEDAGSGYVESSCNSTSEEVTLVLHLTKPIQHVSEVQWVASESTEFEFDSGGFQTCDDTCCLMSPDGKTVRIDLNGATSNMSFAINILGKYVVPKQDYVINWFTNPVKISCTHTADVTTTKGEQMPSWFYGSASIESSGCALDETSGETVVTVTLTLTSPATKFYEIQYITTDSVESMASGLPWTTCNEDHCVFQDGGTTIVITTPVTHSNVFFAANVIGQYVTEPVPFNWQRQPERIYCPDAEPEPGPIPLTITDNTFVFELSEPLPTGQNTTRKYAVFFSQEMTMTYDENGAVFEPSDGGGGLLPSRFTGMMQLAFAGTGEPGNYQWIDTLSEYTGFYAYNPKTRFCVEDDFGYISFDWNKQGSDFLGTNPEGNILTVAVPHQESLLGDDFVDTPFGYRGYVGDWWVMREELPAASMEPDPEAVDRIKGNDDRLSEILAAIEKDSAQQTLEYDCTTSFIHSYEAGKSIAMVARLASISRAFGTDHYVELEETLRLCLDLWLGIVDGIAEDNEMKYDTVWGGLWMRGAGPDEPIYPWTNYGFVSYNDHHFHFGLWIYAAAYYAEYHQSWAEEEDNYNRLMALARDVGSPSKKDPYFPTMRHKDWYLGFSWATGIGGGGRQEESSSEGITCYHALAALGHALNDPVLQGTGQLMTATEIRSTRHYWHVREDNRHLFPTIIQELGVIGQFQEDGIYYYTLNWPCEPDQFPQRHACIVGIQLIPITSVSHLYMDQEWARNVYNICSQAIDPSAVPGASLVDTTWYTLEPVTTRWSSFCQSIMSKVDSEKQEAAAEYINTLDTTDLEPGTGLASTLLFIYEST